MKISELFKIEYGINMELNKCEITTNDVGINFVSRTGQNNGIAAKVMPVKGKIPQPAGVLTCASGGSVLSTYVQIKPFYSGRDLYVLIPLKKMSLNEKLYYCMCIKNNAYRYAYGRQANKTLNDIELPDIIPEWVYSTKIDYNMISTKIVKSNIPLEVTKWKEFSVDKIFNPYLAKPYHKLNLLIIEKGISYVSRTGANNGVDCYVKKDDCFSIENGNAITVGAEGVVFFYQPTEFMCGNKVSILRNTNLNKFNALFVISILNYKLKEKYSYGRALILGKVKEMNAPLPVQTNGEPDWNFMENYIKSLPNSDRI